MNNSLLSSLARTAMALALAWASPLVAAEPEENDAPRFEQKIRPLLGEFCVKCHSTEKHKGDLDLERFSSLELVRKQPKVWQAVIEQLGIGEMPPKDKPQLTEAQRVELLQWANAVLDEIALARAGDPGPVVLRRLSNAEYKYTIRDLTGVPTLDPAREFPVDSASGEGFMNVGNSLVMSPSLVTKYLDAAKDVAAHAVLLPDGLRFSPSTSQRDWTEERLAAIRAFYARYTDNGGGTAVNLQGIKFDTKDGGVLPLEKYLTVTLVERDALRSGGKSIADVARQHGLNAKYLGQLWAALNDSKPSLVLDLVRAQWRTARASDAGALAATIAQWQSALWRFTTVGHIGKRDGPKAWQVPVTPLAAAREVRMKIPAPVSGTITTLYLVASDAGDGNEHDFAVWENPRLVSPGRPDLPLRTVRAAANSLSTHRQRLFAGAVECLAAAAEAGASPDPASLAQLAKKHGVEPAVLSAWLDCLGIGTGEARIDGHLTQKMESAQGYDFIKGWVAADALSVIANSSDQHVRAPGNMKPHGVAVHPSPKLRAIIAWRSPVTTTLHIEGQVQHAHPECGNGVTWALELRRGRSRQKLAAGTAQGAKEMKVGPFDGVSVQVGDVLSLLIGPRDGNHSCDLTAVDLELSDGSRQWSLSKDVSPSILAGNPHADSLGNPAVWHFHSEPDAGGGAEPVLPAGSLLARWQATANVSEKAQLADALEKLLQGGAANLAKDAPDSLLYRQLTSLNGPLLSGFLRSVGSDSAAGAAAPIASDDAVGLDPALFGRHPEGAAVAATSLCVRAPSVIEVRLPSDLVEGCEFVATATLHAETGAEGSVQMQALPAKPTVLTLAAGLAREQGAKSTWSDGERPVVSDSPILVRDEGGARKRLEAALDEFRQLFPAALCYTKIVPVDEVVTLTLFYREDDHLRRLFLDDLQVAEIERLWAELHYVSQDALRLVDAFEQLWQFATQDADPSAFEPLREPIRQRAEAFRKQMVESQPDHLEAALRFAADAYRRPLSDGEKDELRGLYRRLRAEEIPHESAIRLMLARVLVAPAFLYHAEKPGPGAQPTPVTDWELASRLSYFLWSSAPDVELRSLAAQGTLHEPAVLVAQARRMLRDPRVRRLATEFACAWLHVYDFDQTAEKSERLFPTFTGLRGAMYEETIRFFTDLFQDDGRVLDILDADHAFLNAELAKHYGIPDETWRKGELASQRSEPATGAGAAPLETRNSKLETATEWHRVNGVKQFARGGILAQATTLATQSGASRTSPILRGNWLCEVLLGEKLPRPPKDVPRLPEDESTENLTVRQLTEKHTADPKCYGCHRRIDPYGYSLEGFDAIGRRRERDLGDRPVETRVKTMDGAEFDGLEGLRHFLLTQRRDAFLKQFCRKLLGYSLGRGVLISDSPLITGMRERFASPDQRISVAVEAIVRSRQFREIRGREMANED